MMTPGRYGLNGKLVIIGSLEYSSMAAHFASGFPSGGVRNAVSFVLVWNVYLRSFLVEPEMEGPLPSTGSLRHRL